MSAAGFYLINRSSSALSALFTIKLNEKYFNPCPWCQQIKLIIFSVMFPFGPGTGLVQFSVVQTSHIPAGTGCCPERKCLLFPGAGPPRPQQPFHSQPHLARLHLRVCRQRCGASGLRSQRLLRAQNNLLPECLPFSL